MFNNKILSENKIIDELKILFETSKGRVGIGDDAAVIEYNQLISTDAMVEGVHFLRDKVSWSDVAYKLFASNASDIVAMGGYVTGYTLTLSLPEYWTNIELRSFISGMRDFFKDYPADLLGGDTVKSKEFFASVTVFGKTSGRPWLRSNAQEGDFIYCTGTLGDSKMYLDKLVNVSHLPLKNIEYFKKRHYNPTPRTNIITFLKQFPITAAMDISDGLIEDISKLCKSSEKNFFIDAQTLPLSESEIGVENIQEHRVFYQKEALIGGEDYELLFTCSEPINEELLANDECRITRIGRLLSPKDQSFVLYKGQRVDPQNFKGYEH